MALLADLPEAAAALQRARRRAMAEELERDRRDETALELTVARLFHAEMTVRFQPPSPPGPYVAAR